MPDSGHRPSAMIAEFDTIASWTAEAVDELGLDHALPAACRGSGSPAELAWLADGLALDGHDAFLDVGAGIGGPSAWLAEHRHGWRARPVLVDPMPQAVSASRHLFGLPAGVATAEDLPVPDHAVDAAWSLGVLCATSAQERHLAELHRGLVTGGRLALMVLVAGSTPLPETPEGNSFPTRDELLGLLDRAGFAVTAEIAGSALPEADDAWQHRARRVVEVIGRDHGDEQAWRQAEQQQAIMARLMGDGLVSTLLLHARST